MKKTLYIHIGHFKTGTTALQVFFDDHRDHFLKQNFDYAAFCLHYSKHSSLAFSLYQEAGVTELMHNYDDPVPASEQWRGLFDYVRQSESSKVLISSEEFMRLGNFPASVQTLKEIIKNQNLDFDIKIISYLREPQAHLDSWYNQLVKMGQFVPDFNRAVCGSIEPIHYDYALALKPWVDLFGAENVIVRKYEHRNVSPTYIYEDFLSIVGLKAPRDAELGKNDPNPRMDARVVEIARLLRNAGYSQSLVDYISAEAMKYLALQDSFITSDLTPFQDIQDRCEEGLNILKTLPNVGFEPHEFVQNIPEPLPERGQDTVGLIGFVLSELLIVKRRQKHLKAAALTQRIANIEAKLGISEPKE
ncbi:MAG: sulfotransferase domain-containing protein [Pseudoruegeria sp.]